MPMRYDFCLLLCRPISPVGLNTGSMRPIGCANTGFVSRFCLRQYALLCRPISPVGLNTGSVRPIGCANTGFVSPYLARWAQYGLHAPYWLRQYGLCVALLPPAIRALVSPYLARWAQYGLRAPYWLRQYGLCVALSRPLGSIRAPFNTHNAPNTSLQPLRAPLALGAFAFHALKLYETPMPLPLRAPLALGAFAFHALKLYETPMPLPLRG